MQIQDKMNVRQYIYFTRIFEDTVIKKNNKYIIAVSE